MKEMFRIHRWASIASEPFSNAAVWIWYDNRYRRARNRYARNEFLHWIVSAVASEVVKLSRTLLPEALLEYLKSEYFHHCWLDRQSCTLVA